MIRNQGANAVSRIAMWSGPRNISTAMMRSWENRVDTVVVDEPFYACYLTATGIVHPMQEEVLASQVSSWQGVVENNLKAPLKNGVRIQYQKHMAQHMVHELDQDWFKSVKHAFLIRHPAEVVASYGAKREWVSADDFGFALQNKIYQLAINAEFENIPILDAKDVLNNPQKMLFTLCEQLGVPFDPAMLYWPKGPRESDGAWAPHWYQKVEESRCFGVYTEKNITLTPAQQDVVDECLPFYKYLYERRIH